jgi:hypothetical protein
MSGAMLHLRQWENLRREPAAQEGEAPRGKERSQTSNTTLHVSSRVALRCVGIALPGMVHLTCGIIRTRRNPLVPKF